MITCFPDPYPDESMFGLFSRYSERLGRQDVIVMRESAFNKCYGGFGLPSGLRFFAQSLPPGHSCSVDRLLWHHTAFPYRISFLRARNALELRDSMIFGVSGKYARHSTVGYVLQAYGESASSHGLCLDCIDSDRNKVGEVYRHRSHELPGVKVCHLHLAPLFQPNPYYSISDASQSYVFENHGTLTPLFCEKTPIEWREHLVHVALDSSWLLECANKFAELNGIRRYYCQRLRDMKLIAPNGNLRQSRLHDAFLGYYSEDFLRFMGASPRIESPVDWIQLILDTERGGMVAPIRHLLLIRFLGMSAKNFFDEVRAYNQSIPEFHFVSSERDI